TGAFRFSNKARTSIRKKLNIKKGDVVLVFSGTIVRRKGIEILFSALSEIRNKNAKLLIVGSGDSHYMSELKNMAGKLKIINRVIFAGFVNKNKVMDYFSASDIGVWPGNNSVSIIEAMACGLPIVMADMQLSHLVDYGNGVKFPQYNVKKLREALEKLINDKKSRSEMSAKSLRAVTENYSYDLIAKKFLELAR
ncbi:MAG: glycosyltransferase family 4 protein, partial [Nanoarchaeota archaeon]